MFGLEMPSLYTACKLMQALPNGLGGCVLSLDCVHGKASRDMVLKLGYPRWFPTCLGLFKLTQFAANWAADGAYTPLAQCMMAFQLGGAAYTHLVAEAKADGKPGAIGGCVVFSVVTATVQVYHGTLGLGATVAVHALLACLGYATGFVASFLGSKDAPDSPLKLAKRLSSVRLGHIRGFAKTS
jgi:hypothetical protein